MLPLRRRRIVPVLPPRRVVDVKDVVAVVRDGGSVEVFDAEPNLEKIKESIGDYDRDFCIWDLAPTDLNKWIAEGCKDDGI